MHNTRCCVPQQLKTYHSLTYLLVSCFCCLFFVTRLSSLGLFPSSEHTHDGQQTADRSQLSQVAGARLRARPGWDHRIMSCCNAVLIAIIQAWAINRQSNLTWYILSATHRLGLDNKVSLRNTFILYYTILLL